MSEDRERGTVMKCCECKHGTVFDSTTTYFAKANNCYVIIENVPCRKCDECGEIEYSVGVLMKLEEILKTVETLAAKVTILDYKEAA